MYPWLLFDKNMVLEGKKIIYYIIAIIALKRLDIKIYAYWRGLVFCDRKGIFYFQN